jgi:DNA modification methylase
LDFDLNQQIGAQQYWEAARVSCPKPLYTLFCPLYSLWQNSYQFCSLCKKVLRSADVQVVSLGVTSSWGSKYQVVVDAQRVDTVQGCYYYFIYNTIISLMTYIIAIIANKEFAIWPGIHWQNEVQSSHHQAREV